MLALVLGCGAREPAPSTSAARTPAGDSGAIIGVEQRRLLGELSPSPLPRPPPDSSNRWADDARAALLGQRLFFEPSFAGRLLDGDNDGGAKTLGKKGESGKVSCAGCHLPASGFSDTRSVRQQISLAAGWGRRRTPSLLDVGQSKLLMWDGRHDAFYNQVFSVIESPVEMNSSRLFVAHRVFDRHRKEYESVFGEMPPLDDASRFAKLDPTQTGCQKLNAENTCSGKLRGAPGDGAEFDQMTPPDQAAVTRVVVNVGKALGAYQRRLTCGPGRFDRWVHGDASALTPAEQRGAALFVGKARCVRCHSGPYLSDEKFHNVGLRAKVVATVFLNANDAGAAAGLALLESDPLNVRGQFSDGDDGRAAIEHGPKLAGAFRTPRLRCVAKRPAFMHTGQLKTLSSVVEFFDRGGDPAGFPGKSAIAPLGLSAEERADVVAFLQALDGAGPDPALLAPPPEQPPGQKQPTADPR